MSESELQLIRRGFEAVAAGDVDAIAPVLHPDVRWHAGDPAHGCQNRHQALAWLRRPEARGLRRLVDLIDAGDGRYLAVLQPGPGLDDDPGAAPPLRANLATIRDGLVVEMVGYDSLKEAFAAAGVPIRTYAL